MSPAQLTSMAQVKFTFFPGTLFSLCFSRCTSSTICFTICFPSTLFSLCVSLFFFQVHFFHYLFSLLFFQVHFFHTFFHYVFHYFFPGTLFSHFFFTLIFTIFFPGTLFSHCFFTIFFQIHIFVTFQKSKKSVPLRGKQSKWVKKVHFPRNGTLFLHFWNLKNNKKE